jgi:hypothetical protein
MSTAGVTPGGQASASRPFLRGASIPLPAPRTIQGNRESQRGRAPNTDSACCDQGGSTQRLVHRLIRGHYPGRSPDAMLRSYPVPACSVVPRRRRDALSRRAPPTVPDGRASRRWATCTNDELRSSAIIGKRRSGGEPRARGRVWIKLKAISTATVAPPEPAARGFRRSSASCSATFRRKSICRTNDLPAL